MIKTGIEKCKILLPKVKDMSAWAIIACDQFTSEIDYWKKLEDTVKGKPTTLDLVYPEIYLSDSRKERIDKINANIEKYLSDGVFTELDEGFILTVRSTKYVERRIGLIGATDLESYEYGKKTSSLIRATEGTIEERIPPRLEIRKNAGVEFPHIMILFDDEKREITEKLYENRNNYKKLYDFELNMGGGHIEGYFIPSTDEVLEKFSHLLDSERLIAKYGADDKFAFAVGDGNHSLATAKTHWNNLKGTLMGEQRKTHPARYALAEFVNIYDEGIYFEAIYRYVTGVDREKFIEGLKSVTGKFGIFDGTDLVVKDGDGELPETITAVDEYIKDYIQKFGGEVDYVHGEENLFGLVQKDQTAVGVTFTKLDKKDLFKYVSQKGAFPRKTFSMGEGVEKRYYLEGRKIKC